DGFRSIASKLDVGVSNVSWADQAYLGLVYSRLFDELQTGQTMARVYGEVFREQQSFMPSLTFSKRNLAGVDGLSLNLFALAIFRTATTDDTATKRYDWRGDVIADIPDGGEIVAGGGASRYTLREPSQLVRANLAYEASEHHALALNVLASQLRRDGEDDFQPWYSTPFVEPQTLVKVTTGASYALRLWDERWKTTVFGKLYHYAATVNDSALTTDEDGRQITVAKPIDTTLTAPGVGGATRLQVLPWLLAKASAELSYRLPDADEALGNGNTIINAPGLEPEKSRNLNVGLQLGSFERAGHETRVSINAFYRKTQNLILLTVIDGNGTGQYQNIAKTRGFGLEGEAVYRFAKLLEVFANATYLDIRNDQRLAADGDMNIVYNDRLRNTPYLMANGVVRVRGANLFQHGSSWLAYWQTQYVHEFYLRWPSLGEQSTKAVVPTQVTSDLGVSYTFAPISAGTFTLACDVRNLFDAEVYDNYALQKPGRSVFGKITWTL
ncbi:MAG TPA: TonB-dependent receptor, partial [Polyangiales bacterium]|nr:TonB-dependent receptor [Polyangiales bacterium]